MKRLFLLFIALTVMLVGCSEKSSLPQVETGFGSTVVRIGIKDIGSIDVRLFDNDSSEAYNLFIEKISDGSYKGASVSAVIKDYLMMIRAANVPAEAEAPDEMKASALFKRKEDSNVYPIYGSLLISDNFAVDGSFMIITGSRVNIKETEEMLNYKGITLSEYLLSAYGTKLSEEELDLYREHGGAPWLYGVYPCIGQVFGGMDTVERLQRESLVADSTYRPVENLVISDIEIAE